ncbi:MAG: phage head closure protein [Succinivibrionaceae bacterium]|nr:phage head closure protein [Succinivibrionaceae bacterium]
MARPHAGQLRHRIEIGYTKNLVNESGYPESRNIVTASPRASIADVSTGWVYRTIADADTPQFDTVFCVRYLRGVNTGMWVRWKGKLYTIVHIEQYDYKDRWLQLRTRRHDTVGYEAEKEEEKP